MNVSRSFCVAICHLTGVVIGASVLSCSAVVAHDEPAVVARYPDAELHRPTPLPDRIVLTWHGDPTQCQAVTWRTSAVKAPALAEYQVANSGPLFAMNAKQVSATTTKLDADLGPAHYHTARFDGLSPKTKYVYRVGDGVNWSEWSHFTTASEEPEPFSFVYFGDSQNDLKSQWSRVVREAYSDAPKAAFMLHAGDLINRANSDADWGEWFYASSHIHRTISCIATPGNHEYHKAGEVRKVSNHWRPMFEFPLNGPDKLHETVYFIDYQGTRIVSLNSNETSPEQTAWLEKTLKENPNRWTVVTFHHPIFSASTGRDNAELRKTWQPIFDKYRVDLVLQGHDHTYARSGLMEFENVTTGVNQQSPTAGTLYVVSVSGPKMYTLNRRPFMARAAENTQLYQVITIDGDELRYDARTADGTMYDAFTLAKRLGKPNVLINRIPETPERRIGKAK